MLEGATREQIEEQIALEERMVRSGVDLFMSRYNAALEKGRLRETQPGSILLRTLINPLEGAIVEWIEAHSKGRGRRPVALAYMTALEPSVIAYLTLKSAFNSMTDRKMVQTAAKDLGRIIEDECWYREFKKQNPRRFKWAMDKVNEMSTKVRARKILRGQGSRGNVQWTRWPEDHVIQLGSRLLELLRESTGIIEFQMVPTGKNVTPYLVCPTNTTMEWLEQAAEQLSVLHPVFWPMIIKPKPWTNPWDGGYWTEMRRELPLVKTRNKAYLEELEAVNPTEVYRAVNAMQETPWRINKRVLEVLEEAWHRQIEIGKLPAVEEYDLPPKPAGTPKSNPDEWKGWRNKAASIYKTNVKLKSKRLLARRIIEIAKDFSKYEQIFFPYQMDFRGRIYAMPNFLNPQGADHAKALLTFTEGKPINDGVAAGWLAVHGANCYGEDKISLEERVEWVEDHTDQILSVAEDPWGPEFEFWSNADEPWQFLAFCFEWAGFVTEGYGFVSSLPVMLDGSCNGLQHFSAILRDEVGGKSVNLTPSEAPSDIYREVADVVNRKLADIIETGDEEARDLAEKWCKIGVTRKTTKTPVMTLPYGSTRYACREFLEEYLEEEIRKTGFNPFRISEQNDGIYRATLFLAPIVWESIGEVVQSAHRAMEWLQKVARVATKADLPINWTTPDGFYVSQRYPNLRHREIRTTIDGKIVKLRMSEEEETKLDSRRQAQGISPNFVHSLDACALRMYVNLALDNGVRHFALVHDSYGTVAADVQMMSACLRHAFVEIYRDGQTLERFRDEVCAPLEERYLKEIPEIPEKGHLDIELVLKSDFFFA